MTPIAAGSPKPLAVCSNTRAMSDLQALADAVAADLGRPVGVDDRGFRAVAYSSHPDGVDAVRLASILQREAPGPVSDWLESLGVRTAEGYTRVPANAELGMTARVCVPLRFERILLGYLWLIDEPESLTDEELREVDRYAEEFGIALYRERLLERDTRRHQHELAGRLLGIAAGGTEAAAEELLRGGHLAPAPAYAVLWLSAVGPGNADPTDAVGVRLLDAAEQVRRSVAPHHWLAFADGRGVSAILVCVRQGEARRRAESLAAAAGSRLDSAGPGWRALVGVGAEVRSLLGIESSYRQATAAVRVGVALEGEEAVASWEDLGAYRTLTRMLGDRDPGALLPDSFQRLLDSSEAVVLVETLERFLDLGGDARAAADLLHIHRSSLYGRLHRIEEVAGVDLHSGEDRLELHLGVRLWRLGAGVSGDPD